MSFWLSVILQSASTDVSIGAFDLKQTRQSATLLRSSGCGDNSDADEVVVCGRKQEAYRLPLPAERDPLPGPYRGEAQSGMSALAPSGRCGIFAGERQCSKSEAAEYGYGNGRDPITVLMGVAKKVVDPDGD